MQKEKIKIHHNKNLFLIIIILIFLFVLLIFLNFVNNKTKYLTNNDLRIELENLGKINAYPNNMEININDYPKIIGRYSKNGLILVERYYCSDLCPNNGRVFMVFENISKEECSKIGGEEVNAVFPPEYLGCKPKIDITNKDIDKEIKECVTDSDCIPATCCHSFACVPITEKPNCNGIFCTQECAPGTLDCNQGNCMCVNGKCKAVLSD